MIAALWEQEKVGRELRPDDLKDLTPLKECFALSKPWAAVNLREANPQDVTGHSCQTQNQINNKNLTQASGPWRGSLNCRGRPQEGMGEACEGWNNWPHSRAPPHRTGAPSEGYGMKQLQSSHVGILTPRHLLKSARQPVSLVRAPRAQTCPSSATSFLTWSLHGRWPHTWVKPETQRRLSTFPQQTLIMNIEHCLLCRFKNIPAPKEISFLIPFFSWTIEGCVCV